jgi:hypothetical protein
VVSTNNRGSDIDTVFRSTNGGRTWTSLKDSAVLDVSETPYLTWGGDKPTFGWWIQALALDPYDSTHIVYGTGRDPLRHPRPHALGPADPRPGGGVHPPPGLAADR